jgi:hypothetical protein
MEGTPILQQPSLAAIPNVSFQVRTTAPAIVNSQGVLSLNHQRGKLVLISRFAEWTSDAPELPSRAAAAARKEPTAGGIDTGQLGHGR